MNTMKKDSFQSLADDLSRSASSDHQTDPACLNLLGTVVRRTMERARAQFSQDNISYNTSGNEPSITVTHEDEAGEYVDLLRFVCRGSTFLMISTVNGEDSTTDTEHMESVTEQLVEETIARFLRQSLQVPTAR